MAGKKSGPDNNEGFSYGRENDKNETNSSIRSNRFEQIKDEDLIIEENTIYEIDRECYERLRRKRKK